MWRLFKPLDYLRISHPEKWRFDWFVPGVVGLGISLTWFVQDFRANLFDSDGFINQIQGLISILSGFFIAALAAVATFDSPGMDRTMPGKVPVTLQLRMSKSNEHLTRRRFLCLLFGYLAFLSLTLYLVTLIVSVFGNAVQLFADEFDFSKGLLFHFVKWFLWLSYCVALSQLFTNTLLGLYYLTDRIHRDDGHSVSNAMDGVRKRNAEPAE